MKKALLFAFAGICVVSSITANSGNTGRMNSNQQLSQLVRDTVPNKKTDTSRYPKRDTTSMPKMVDPGVK
jgi:hypothetical protein